jgi:hypothetical protein
MRLDDGDGLAANQYRIWGILLLVGIRLALALMLVI